MTNAAAPTQTYYTDPNTGQGISCEILKAQDGDYLILLEDGQTGAVTAGDLYRLDESGRYLGGPVDL